ncbi:MAG TPA: chemotaxis response regulator protein-glutamate methylesterase, partial [Acetobacteraceae bacterium]|nr:chemotaxis response regulator protein-glutamate methylesterase [Acetobacteraceae bacterium]
AAPARVMICDDSATIRGAISRMLESDPGIQVVSKASNGRMAIEELKRTKVDVLVLDIEMPVLDGMTALPLLLQTDPGLKIVMASTLTTRGADIAMRALRMGAADYVPKPSTIGATSDERFKLELISKVKGLARLRNRAALPPRPAPSCMTRPAPVLPPKLLAIGSSTGGPQALFTLIQALGRSVNVPIVLTQHMPATFTPILAEHITRLGGLPCAEAKDGEALLPGQIYLAPGDKHLIVERDGASAGRSPASQPNGQRAPMGAVVARARLSTDPPENFCRPAVDPMLRSAAGACDGRVLVTMLTGMGHDGLAGTRRVVEAGGAAIAQDEATSVVWGMPGAIAQAGLCHAVLPLPRIAQKLLEMLRVPAK